MAAIRWAILIGAYLLACYVASPMLAIEIQNHLFFGWIEFLADVLRRMTWSVPGILSALVWWSLFVVVLQLSARRLFADSRVAGGWRPRWTLLIAGTIAILFIAGTAFHGLVESVLTLPAR